MQFLERPAGAHEFVRQPIEQLRMCRLLTEPSKVTGSCDQAATEVVHPNSIHKDARDERVLAVRQPASVCQAAAGGRQVFVIEWNRVTARR